MTFIMIEGFETVGDKSTTGADVETNLEKGLYQFFHFWGHSGGPVLIDNDEADGTLALRMPSTTTSGGRANLRYELPSAYQVSMNGSHWDVVMGFRFRNAGSSPTVSAEREFWSWEQGGSSVCELHYEPDNSGDLIWDDLTGNITAPGALTPGGWNYVEIEFKPASSSNGYVRVYVDGNLVINESSRSTAQSFYTSRGFALDMATSTPGTGSDFIAFDDVYLLDADGSTHTERLGERRVIVTVPNSDETPNDWTPASGVDNYAMLDGVEPDNAVYVEADTSGDDDHYGLTDISASNVECLQIDVECVSTDGSPTLHVGFDDGTADEVSGGVIGTGSNTVVRALFPTDPSGAAWSQTSVNSVEATQRMTE